MRENPAKSCQLNTGVNPRVLPQRDPWIFTQVIHNGKREMPRSFGTKEPSCSPYETEACRGQLINGAPAQVHLTVGPVGPWTYPVVISPAPNCLIAMDLLQNKSSH